MRTRQKIILDLQLNNQINHVFDIGNKSVIISSNYLLLQSFEILLQ